MSLPDELMIDWTGVPKGAIASIFLPAADADGILKKAASLYGGQNLTRTDAHTLVCEANNLTYIPIPAGSISNYAGLLTLDIPSGISVGPCKVIARQVTNGTAPNRDRRIPAPRRVLGAFQLTVAVGTARTLLEPEERLLAFFRWILSTLAVGDRWHPVIQRYVGEIALRVKVFGGDPGIIGPSQVGAIPRKPASPSGAGGPSHPSSESERSGKIEGLVYDRFGDFEGFVLHTDCGAKVTFHTRERHFAELAKWAWSAQMRVTVFARDNQPRVPERIVLHTPPNP
jgi:hypothetical protein